MVLIMRSTDNHLIDGVISLDPSTLSHASDDQLYLLTFVFTSGSSRLRALSAHESQELLHASKSNGAPLPNAAFELIVDEKHLRPLNGEPSAKTNSLFGKGTYLSTELNVSLLWSPFSAASSLVDVPWSTLSCVALCRVIADDHGVKVGCNTDACCSASDEVIRRRHIPQTYIIVQNNDLVRVTHLLVYWTTKSSPKPEYIFSQRVVHWLRNNVFWILIFLYVVVLLLVALMEKLRVRRYVDRISNAFFETHDNLATFD
ncbi:unnamed protein product [Soboliphyme baturini]|uniref:PARP catalytic domain-containing protein n=1 Tax=Soboliphyme baturini TaxID=241478 RepID=A0A183J011_9BILA|nr:unnamed protein product [Soboliphyme baturini]